ncbi:E3 ubiquitin- ligase DZIP3, partial [Paramuricea clavata]
MDAFLKEIELREAHKPTTEKPENHERRKNNIYGHAGGSAAALFTRQGHGNYGRIKCAYCLGEHSHENCKKITDINERKQLIRKYGRCFICLKKGHISKNCSSNVNCNACGKRHHRSVCEGTGVPTDHVQSNHSILGSQSRVALQTAQALVKGVKGSPRVRVLFDTGSHKSFVSRKVVKAAGVPAKRKEWIEIKSFGQEKAEGKLHDVFELEVLPVTGGESMKIEAYGVEYVSQIRNEHVELKKRDYSHLQGLWFSDVCKENEVLEIEVLIGADYLWCFQEGNVVRGKADEPVAVQTRLGWVLSGPMKVNGSSNETNSMHVVDVNFLAQDNSSCTKLDDFIHRLWDFETLGIRQEDEVHESLKDSIKFNGTRYSVKLPWKEGHSALPSNYNISLKRLKGEQTSDKAFLSYEQASDGLAKGGFRLRKWLSNGKELLKRIEQSEERA